jgi:hypothetical protein
MRLWQVYFRHQMESSSGHGQGACRTAPVDLRSLRPFGRNLTPRWWKKAYADMETR